VHELFEGAKAGPDSGPGRRAVGSRTGGNGRVLIAGRRPGWNDVASRFVTVAAGTCSGTRMAVIDWRASRARWNKGAPGLLPERRTSRVGRSADDEESVDNRLCAQETRK
jgi:hypothetical protein